MNAGTEYRPIESRERSTLEDRARRLAAWKPKGDEECNARRPGRECS
jgi:hypothetical protein